MRLRSMSLPASVLIQLGSKRQLNCLKIVLSKFVRLLVSLWEHRPPQLRLLKPDAIANGADEIDMVINIGALKSRNLKLVEDDIKAVVEASGSKLVKVIIETCLLTDEEKVEACQLAKLAGADFVKTSTGFSTGGATIEDIELMREAVGPIMGVKASGGARTLEAAQAFIKAGATRIGTSSGVAIMKGQESHDSY